MVQLRKGSMPIEDLTVEWPAEESTFRPIGRITLMRQVTDTGAIEKAVDEIVSANPDKVEAVKAKPGMLGWFVGQVMKATGGKANPQAVSDALKRRLGI
jgi:Asp-tRNA(Asn)/Glu-tRNA(Gln) amidotransferase B subunit